MFEVSFNYILLLSFSWQRKKVYAPRELAHHFMPLIEKLKRAEDSEPFHVPVDPVALEIPVR